MTRQSSLTHRVAELLRRRPVRVLTEREASDQLRPHGQGVHGAPADCPLTTHAPSAGNLDGARGELVFDDANSTG